MFLQNKPIPKEKLGNTFCSCGRFAIELSPSVKGGRVLWIPRCMGCTGPNQKGKQ